MVLAAEPPEMTHRIDPGGVERLGAILVDQGHRALHHLLRVEIDVVRMGENIDQRIAQAQNFQGRRHRPALKMSALCAFALRQGAVNRDGGAPRAEAPSCRRHVVLRASDVHEPHTVGGVASGRSPILARAQSFQSVEEGFSGRRRLRRRRRVPSTRSRGGGSDDGRAELRQRPIARAPHPSSLPVEARRGSPGAKSI